MIFVAVGSNLSAPDLGGPLEICTRALTRLDSTGITVTAVSRFYETAPVPVSDQPWFVNAVARVTTSLDAATLLERLHQVEQAFGRVRHRRNEARVLDLDLIDYNGVVSAGPPILPHPRMADRAFVLLPLYDLAPNWVHPSSRLSITDLIAALPSDQAIRRVSGLE